MRGIKNLIGSVLIGVAAFLFWVLILPTYDGRAILSAEIEARSADLEMENQLISRAEELDKEFQGKYAELKRLSLIVPAEKHVDELITIVEDMFSANGVPLNDLLLSVDESSVSNLPYNLVNMDFNFTASYDSTVNFLYSVEKSLRLLDATSLDININERSAADGGETLLDVGLKAKAYFLNKNVQVKNVVKSNESEE